MTTLTQAHNQWAKRAPDERFSSLDDLHTAARAYRDNAASARAAIADLKATVLGTGAVGIEGKSGTQCGLTHWAFGQLAEKARAPASYLRTLPAPLAVDCLNNGLRAAGADDAESALLLDRRDGLNVRAVTSTKYERIWNTDVTSRLVRLADGGPWQPAPAAFDGSRGLYLSDCDMFAFLVDNERRIFERLPGGGLSRGFFVWNSETGAASFGICTFLYEYVCGNHRVWGAQNIKEVRLRHVGDVNDKAFKTIEADLIEYARGSAAEDEAKIQAMRTRQLGANKEEVLDAIFKLRVPQLTRKVAAEAYALAEQREDWYDNPRSVWGMAGAITEIARDKPNASDRDALNRAGAKLMEIAL